MKEKPFSNKAKQEVLTIPQAAALCGVSRWTLRNLVTSGRLRASQTHGGHYRILREDLEFFIRENALFSLEQPSSRRILIADDDPKIRRLLGTVLTNNGYEVDYAVDGFETGKKVVKFRPDLILLDLVMPKMDGFEVCRHLKEDSETKGIKIIAISGYDTEKNKQRILDCGADLFLGKAFNIKNLMDEIDRLLAEKVVKG